MRRKHEFTTGSVYHIYNRGVRKNKIYNSSSDYKRWEELLFWSTKYMYPYSVYLNQLKQFRDEGRGIDVLNKRIENEYKYAKPLVNILAYIEMPNHFHLVLEQNIDNGIMTYMKKLQTAYAMYLNIKYNLSGSAFEGIYKSVPVISDPQFIQLLKYVLRNPIEANLILPKDILKYQWSSVKNYLNHNDQKPVSIDRLPEDLLNPTELVKFLLESDSDLDLPDELSIDNI